MFYGTVVFLGKEIDLRKVVDIIDVDNVLADVVQDMTGPHDIHIDRDGVVYKVEFGNDQWIDLSMLQSAINNNDVDIIHALTDGSTFIEVISTNADYDDYENADDTKLEDLASLYNLTFNVDFTSEDEEEIEEEDEDDNYNSWD